MPRRIGSTTSALLIAATVVIAGTTGAIPRDEEEKVYRIAGEGRDDKDKPTPVEVLSASESGVSVSIRYLEPAQAAQAAGSVLAGAGAIFRARTETDRGHLVFILQIENQSPADIIYEPGQGRLITDRSDAEFPMDYTMLYRLLEGMPGGAPPLEEVEKAVYSRSTTIRSGGSVRKLLVFEGPRDERFKKLEIRVGTLNMAERDIDPRFQFRRFEVTP